MKKILSFLLVIMLMVPNFAFATTETYLDHEKDADIEFFLEVYNYIKTTYPLEYNDRQIIEGGLKGMLNSLDPYSSYYNIEESIELYNQLSGSFSGIGIYVEERNGYINITETIKDQPAEKAGLKKDDLIIKVDDKDILNMPLSEVTKLIKGPIDTKVKLQIKRGTKTIVVEVLRKNIESSSVEYEILDNKIGYLQISQFQDTTLRDVKKALAEFDKQNLKKVIIDLRNNPGGLLDETIEIAKLFIPRGPIVHIRQKNKALMTHGSTLSKQKYDLVVLVNEKSASASEILAGAIKESKAGKVIGTKTYGKGIVQSIRPLTNGSVIKMTTAEYLLPNMTSIHGKGIAPNIIVENTVEEDLQLKKAIELLKN
jgi:carboxyl-terminal processing protease